MTAAKLTSHKVDISDDEIEFAALLGSMTWAQKLQLIDRLFASQLLPVEPCQANRPSDLEAGCDRRSIG